MSRSLIDFGHATFVYIAEVHSRFWECCLREKNRPKKSVWGGAIRPCKRRVASQPSRIYSLVYYQLTVKGFFPLGDPTHIVSPSPKQREELAARRRGEEPGGERRKDRVPMAAARYFDLVREMRDVYNHRRG